MKIVNKQRKSSYLPNDLRTLNEFFRKNVSYDNFKSHKKQGLTPSLESTVLEKPKIWGGGQTEPPAFLGLILFNACN